MTLTITRRDAIQIEVIALFASIIIAVVIALSY